MAAFVMTLFAFVAGFILLYCLQEYSNARKDFKSELGAWHSIHDLVQFFQDPKAAQKLTQLDRELEKDPKDADLQNRHKLAKRAKENDCYSHKIMQAISEISDSYDDNAPYRTLKTQFGNIKELKPVDENDHAALDAIIQQYTKLRVLLRQREDKKVETPTMLIVVLWIGAIVSILFASVDVLVLVDHTSFVKQDSYPPAQRIKLIFGLAFVVLPIVIIVLTIKDLKQPFEGEWKIDVQDGYRMMAGSLIQPDAGKQKTTPWYKRWFGIS